MQSVRGAAASAHSSHRRERDTETLKASTFTYTHTELYYFELISLYRNWKGSKPLYICQIKLGRKRETERDRTAGPGKEEMLPGLSQPNADRAGDELR